MRTIGRLGKKNICTLSSHRLTARFMRRQYAHRAPRRELYAVLHVHCSLIIAASLK